MRRQCRFCGRYIEEGNVDVCRKCRSTLCEMCGEALARGYCAVCGKLICDDHGEMVGYARVCESCIVKDPNLRSYDYLKSFIFRLIKIKNGSKLKPIFTVEKSVLEEKVFGAVGIDDTDSPYGMCTTYLGALILEKIAEIVEFYEYPYLVRLNPNIPFKTRGNASVKIVFKTQKELIDEIVDAVIGLVEEKIHAYFPKTQPAVSFYFGRKEPEETPLYRIYRNALIDIITVDEAINFASKVDEGVLRVYTTKEKARGLIGSLAALGARFDKWTYELLAYRDEKNIGTPRKIKAESVARMDRRFREYMFANIDGERILITPQGPDPVLYGLRGFRPDILIEAAKMLKGEKPSIWVIYKTNQGTNSHVLAVDCISDARVYQTIQTEVEVTNVLEKDTRVIVEGKNCGWLVKINLYKPHRKLRSIAKKLVMGDIIKIVGNVLERKKDSIEINLEEMELKELMPEIKYHNPICPNCGVSLKSKGKKTYKCKHCGYLVKEVDKITILSSRQGIPVGKRLLPPPRSWRHLTKPLNFDDTKLIKYRKPITPIFGRNL